MWVVLNPIIMFGAQSIVFRLILRLEIPNFLVFLLGGLLPWIFTTQTIDMAIPLLQSQDQLLKSFKINPLVLLWSQVLDNLTNFIASFAILLIAIMFTGFELTWYVAFLPIALVILLIGVLGMSWFLAILQVFYRDTKYIMQFLTGIMFFLTPIFYPIHFVPEKFRIFIYFNPFYCLIESFRSTIYDPSIDKIMMAFARGAAFALFFFVIAYFNWRSKKNEFYLKL